MQFDHVAISLRLVLPGTKPLAPVMTSAASLGESLAEAIDQHVRQHRIGYFPPLDYFEDSDMIDRSLIETARQMAWQSSKLARELIEKQLKPVFSTVQFKSIQTMAFNMPGVRPNQADALQLLAEHYTPDTIRVDLEVSMVRRDTDRRRDSAEGYVRKMVFRWLSESFDRIEITSSTAQAE